MDEAPIISWTSLTLSAMSRLQDLLGEESPDKYQELTSDTPGLETTTQRLRLGTGLKLTLVWSIFNALPQPIGQ